MPLYDFRLRFNFPESYRIGSDAEEIELLVLPLGQRIRIRSGAPGTPMKDHPQVTIFGESFPTEKQARDAAEKTKRTLLHWAIERRVGIDFGDGRQRGGVSKAYLAMLQEQHGCPVRNDVHGIDVYEHVEKLKFVRVEGKAELSKHRRGLTETFQREYLYTRDLTQKQVLGCEIYGSSFFDVSPRSRFITLVTAVEALLEPLERSNEVEALIEEVKARTRQSTMDRSTKDSILGSLERLRHQSIRQAGCALVVSLIPDELFDGQSSADFFDRCYELRSQILHRGKIEDKSVDVLHLANIMESFVARLLLASLNSVPRQDIDTGDDD